MVSHRLTAALAILLVCCTLMNIIVANPLDAEMPRPIRPSTFNSVNEVKEYVNKLKDYYKATTGGRYGKRSFPDPELPRGYYVPVNRYCHCKVDMFSLENKNM